MFGLQNKLKWYKLNSFLQLFLQSQYIYSFIIVIICFISTGVHLCFEPGWVVEIQLYNNRLYPAVATFYAEWSDPLMLWESVWQGLYDEDNRDWIFGDTDEQAYWWLPHYQDPYAWAYLEKAVWVKYYQTYLTQHPEYPWGGYEYDESSIQVAPSLGMQILNSFLQDYPAILFFNPIMTWFLNFSLTQLIFSGIDYCYILLYNFFISTLSISKYLYNIHSLSFEGLAIYNSFIFSILQLVCTQSIRLKFLYFFWFLLTASYWGFYFSFDGLILVLLLIELTLLFVFLLIFNSLSFAPINKLLNKKKYYTLYISLNVIFLIIINNNITLYTINYYDYIAFKSYIISSDFFIFFYFFYILYPVVVLFLAFLLGLFSIFFIFIFFSLKVKNLSRINNLKLLFILRKQNLIHQAAYNPYLKIFQK